MYHGHTCITRYVCWCIPLCSFISIHELFYSMRGIWIKRGLATATSHSTTTKSATVGSCRCDFYTQQPYHPLKRQEYPLQITSVQLNRPQADPTFPLLYSESLFLTTELVTSHLTAQLRRAQGSFTETGPTPPLPGAPDRDLL